MSRRQIARLVIGVLLFVAVVIAAAGYFRTTAPVAGEAGTQAMAESEEVYTLKLEGSTLFVYAGNESSPQEEYTLPPELLPESDRAALTAGVTCYGNDELQKRLEDYLG